MGKLAEHQALDPEGRCQKINNHDTYTQDSGSSKRLKPYVVKLELIERRAFVCYVAGVCNKNSCRHD